MTPSFFDALHRVPPVRADASFMLTVFPIGSPLAYLSLLYASRHKINPPHTHMKYTAVAKRNADTTLVPIRPLFTPFRPRFWWFEPMDMLRRIFMMGIMGLIPGKPIRAGIAFMMAMLFAALYREMSPYASTTLTSISSSAHYLLILVYAAGVVINGRPFGYNSVVLGMILLVISIVLVLVAAVLQAKHGSSSVELEQRVLEYEAREADLKLSHAELLGDANSKSELERKDEDQLAKLTGATHVNVVYKVGPIEPKKTGYLKFKDGFNVAFYGCWVVSHTEIVKFDRLSVHEDALKSEILVELKPTSRMPAPSHSFFVSQNWEGSVGTGPFNQGKHPDNDLNTKLLWIQNIKKHLHIAADQEIWIWWDGISVPQINIENQGKAVKSLCYCE